MSRGPRTCNVHARDAALALTRAEFGCDSVPELLRGRAGECKPLPTHGEALSPRAARGTQISIIRMYQLFCTQPSKRTLRR